MSRRSYLDHASTSTLRPVGLEAMYGALQSLHGDPGRMHHDGMTVRVALEQAREHVATFVGARPREVIFTSGATEAIAAACWGLGQREGVQAFTAVEHSAVRMGAQRGAEAITLGVDDTGRLDLDALESALRNNVLSAVHVQWSNHEIGTAQPIDRVIAMCHEHDVLVHVDAAQGVGHDDINFKALGADLLSLSGHKFGAPPGTGALLVRRGLRIAPLLVGGDQERARRAGLENTPAFVGLGAVAHALSEPDVLAFERTRAWDQTTRLIDALSALEGVDVLGHRDHRAPHLVCVSIADVEPQAVILGLDRAGVSAHSGSSCATESLEPSPVLEAMGVDAAHSLRLSVGWDTTDDDIDRVFAALPEILGALRALRG